MKSNISKQIANLPSLSRQQLLDLWQELHGRAAPRGIRRELMVPFLAYRMQERAYGGLKPSTRSELRRIARDLEKLSGSKELKIRPRIRPGTRLLRQWRGESDEVVVANSGYEYRGTNYNTRLPREKGVRITHHGRWSSKRYLEGTTELMNANGLGKLG
jgi:hypothetical protein